MGRLKTTVDIRLNANPYEARTTAPTLRSGQFDFQTVITHEISHSLGLGHSGEGASVMFPQLSTAVARRTMVRNDLNIAGETGGSGLHAEALFAANLSQNVVSAGQDSSPLTPASNLKLAGPTGFAAATPLRSIVKDLTTDKSLNVATVEVTRSRDLNTGLRRAAKESAWRSAIGSSEVETLTEVQDIDSFFASLTDNDGEMLDSLMDYAFSELRN